MTLIPIKTFKKQNLESQEKKTCLKLEKQKEENKEIEMIKDKMTLKPSTLTHQYQFDHQMILIVRLHSIIFWKIDQKNVDSLFDDC